MTARARAAATTARARTATTGAVTARGERALRLSTRLASIYLLLVAATILVVSAVAVQLTRIHLERGLDRRILASVTSFERGPARRVASPEDLERVARRWLASHGFASDELAAIRLPDGTILTPAGGIPIESVEGRAALLGAATSRWWDLDEGRLRALSVPLAVGETTVGTLVVGASRAGVTATLGAVLSGIAWAAGAGMALAIGLGLLAIRRALRPLGRMWSEVSGIEETGDLRRRVGHSGPADEVGRLAAAFDAMLDRLEGAFASQRAFLSDASHELRTPLTVIRGRLELLAADLERSTDRGAVQAAMAELDRMGRIIDDLLLLARLDEGAPLALEPVEVELVLQEAVIRGLEGAHREVRVTCEPGVAVLADPERLLQVVTNLVSNAVRHAGEAARIALEARREDDRVTIEVSDTGRGIEAQEQDRVFERLYRGGPSRSEPGSGLGLAIVSSLVAAMGGEVRLRSAPGEGATFAVTLPAAGDRAPTVPG